jgi:hypothetical protein
MRRHVAAAAASASRGVEQRGSGLPRVHRPVDVDLGLLAMTSSTLKTATTLLTLALGSAIAFAGSADIPAAHDAMIFGTSAGSDTGNASGKGPAMFAGADGGLGKKRSLVTFDLGTYISGGRDDRPRAHGLRARHHRRLRHGRRRQQPPVAHDPCVPPDRRLERRLTSTPPRSRARRSRPRSRSARPAAGARPDWSATSRAG